MRRRHRLRARPTWSLNRMIPNILTLLALCAGMTAIRLALNGRFEAAVTAIIIAGVLDGVDGRIARLLKGISSFGAQLDSLSDFISFGVAPALLLYIWTMDELRGIGWALVLLFGVCCALRLARFNTQIGAELPPCAYNFFPGVPAPAGAGLVMIPMMLWFATGVDLFRSPYLNGVVLAAVGALMVSRIPTFSFKRFRVRSEWVLPMMLVIGLLAAFLTTEPWPTLLALGAVYIASFPISIRAYRRLRENAEKLRTGPREIEAAHFHEEEAPEEEGGDAARQY
jgi:CDP-diacylglycerol--serine O-phosphatidyltransferase